MCACPDGMLRSITTATLQRAPPGSTHMAKHRQHRQHDFGDRILQICRTGAVSSILFKTSSTLCCVADAEVPFPTHSSRGTVKDRFNPLSASRAQTARRSRLRDQPLGSMIEH